MTARVSAGLGSWRGGGIALPTGRCRFLLQDRLMERVSQCDLSKANSGLSESKF